MHIGLIGGIGPAATVLYYERLVAAYQTHGQILEATIVHADMHRLMDNAAANDRDAQAAVYANHISDLKAAGADVAVITSLGGHFCYDETTQLAELPLISAVTPLDTYFKSNGFETVGLLGTRQVTSSGLYGQLACTTALAPSDADLIHDTYLDMAKSGHCTDAQRALFFDAGREMIARGATAVVMAGTDLSLAFDGHHPGFAVVDAVRVHVDHIVAQCTETLK